MKHRCLNKAVWLMSVMLMGLSLSSNAALINRGGGMIYDDVLDVTWLQDANLMATSGDHRNGLSNHSYASNWVSNLNYGGYSDWRLPSIEPQSGGNLYDTNWEFDGSTDRGYNVSGAFSELGYMFFVNLQNLAYYSESGLARQPGYESFNSTFTDGETGLNYSFENIGRYYWSEDVDRPYVNAAWGFYMHAESYTVGEQTLWNVASNLNAWAVRDGDVASVLQEPDPQPGTGNSNDIPEPNGLALFGFGLAGFLAIRRQNKESQTG